MPRTLLQIAIVVLGAAMLALFSVIYFAIRPAAPADVRLEITGPAVTFAAFGDQGTGNYRQYQIANALDTIAGKRGLDFVALLGDNFYRYGVSGVEDAQWRYKFENMYSGEHLARVPFFAVLGNHDYYGDAQAQIIYSRERLGSGRWQMPGTDYLDHFGRIGDEHLLRVAFLDTSPGIRPEAETAVVLDELLTVSAPARWTVIATHAPVRSSRDFYDHTPLREALMPVLRAHGVHAYFAGHDHNFQVLHHEGEPVQVITGSGGKYGQAITDGHDEGLRFVGFSLGFALVSATAEQMTIELVNEDTDIIYELALRANALITTP